MKKLYDENFSLHLLNVDMSSKFALISMLCYITKALQARTPDVTMYQVIYKLTQNQGLPEEFLKTLTIICEDFMLSSGKIETFNLKITEMPSKIKEILNNYMPF